MIDVEALRRQADLVEIVGADVELQRRGDEYVACCPFHSERTPSFTVVPGKGYVHCFGCGAHHDVIGYVMRVHGLDFIEACRRIGGQDLGKADLRQVKQERARRQTGGLWVQILPVPEDAEVFRARQQGRMWNPKRGSWWKFTPERADAYRDADGRLLGYVLRINFSDGTKVTPVATWCIGPDGTSRWCCKPWARPRPLCGLDVLAAKPDAPVLVVEGEKCREIAERILPGYAVVCWPGGSNGLKHVDWSPLEGRDLVLFPDADDAGHHAMLGYERRDGRIVPGVAQYAARVGASGIRMVDTANMPRGWDIADAVAEGWTRQQIAAWAAPRIVTIHVTTDRSKPRAA